MLGMYTPLIGAVLVAGVFAAGFGAGYKIRDGAASRERAAAVEAQLDETLKEIERGNALTFRFEEERRKRSAASNGLARQAGDLRDCRSNPPDHLVRLLDAAATETDMQPASGSACTPGAATYDHVARILISNYSIAQDCQSQLNALIDFVEGHP